MRTITYAAIASLVLLTACGKQGGQSAPEPRFVEAHSTRDLMKYVVDPSAQLFWRSSGSSTDASGTVDHTPTTEEGWAATRSAAATVAEMGNLLMTPPYAKGRGEDWVQFSADLAKAGMRAEKAAADKNGEAVFNTGGDLYTVCSACHGKYPPKGAQGTAAAAPANSS